MLSKNKGKQYALLLKYTIFCLTKDSVYVSQNRTISITVIVIFLLCVAYRVQQFSFKSRKCLRSCKSQRRKQKLVSQKRARCIQSLTPVCTTYHSYIYILSLKFEDQAKIIDNLNQLTFSIRGLYRVNIFHFTLFTIFCF